MLWDERESFSRSVGRLFIGLFTFGFLALAAVGAATDRIELVLAAVGVLGAVAAAVLLWLVAATPILLLFLALVRGLAWIRGRAADDVD